MKNKELRKKRGMGMASKYIYPFPFSIVKRKTWREREKVVVVGGCEGGAYCSSEKADQQQVGSWGMVEGYKRKTWKKG